VSAFWADRLLDEFGVNAVVVPNGVDADRFAGCPLSRDEAGARMGWGDRPVVLAVGGVQPRKGSRVLLEAFAHGKHVVNVTVEADAFCGPLLARRAQQAGVVSSLACGDQPARGVQLELVPVA
jgi:glycosyltransferase involved in cell wall biosynthesis